MLFLVICTEGDVSEPEYVKALVEAMKGQQPQSGSNLVEVIPISVGGNQGHRKIIKKAEEKIELALKDPESLLVFFEEGDKIEKWLICDYDEMDKRGINLSDFREFVSRSGYTLVINKPNFEFFVVCLLGGLRTALEREPSDYKDKADKLIETINKNDKKRGFSDTMLLPRYAKKTYMSRDLFKKLASYHLELIENLPTEDGDESTNFTEMIKLIERLKLIYTN